MARDPLTRKTLEVGTTVFADDVAETKLANELDELQKEIVDSNEIMEAALHKQGMAQNGDKAVHIVACMGKGSPETLRKLGQWSEKQKLGKVCSKERYLGNIKHYNGLKSFNTERRINTAQECFYSMGSFWKRPGVHFRVKKMIYKGLIENALLSGLEAEALTNTEYAKLEKWNIRYMRKVLGPDNSVDVNGERRQISNTEVRSKFNTHTLDSTMSKRRLDWLVQIVDNPDDNAQLRAGVFGKLEVVANVDIGWNPWVLQWEKDLESSLS